VTHPALPLVAPWCELDVGLCAAVHIGLNVARVPDGNAWDLVDLFYVDDAGMVDDDADDPADGAESAAGPAPAMFQSVASVR
jgi:hypothetical protein